MVSFQMPQHGTIPVLYGRIPAFIGRVNGYRDETAYIRTTIGIG